MDRGAVGELVALEIIRGVMMDERKKKKDSLVKRNEYTNDVKPSPFKSLPEIAAPAGLRRRTRSK